MIDKIINMSTKIKITQIEQENNAYVWQKMTIYIIIIYDDRIFVYITSEINIYKYMPKINIYNIRDIEKFILTYIQLHFVRTVRITKLN